MKIVFKILGLLLIIGVVYLAINGRNIQTVETHIHISATPDKVWQTIIAIEHWQDWNPIVDESNGQAAVDSTVSITMKGEKVGQEGPQYAPLFIKLDEAKTFHWRASMLAEFLFTNEKIIELKAVSSGTDVIHTETFKGLLSPLFSGQLEKSVRPMLTNMNQALKETVEQ